VKEKQPGGVTNRK